jgi:VIT1/CCC1 family predicted Fe2+/Mn2+ transporter
MQVRVQVKILPPGMKHGEEADVGTEMLRVACNRQERFRYGMEEETVDRLFVVKGDAGDLLRECEDKVEILHRQQFRGALRQPLGARQPLALGAMTIAAGAVVSMGVLAAVAPFDHPA